MYVSDLGRIRFAEFGLRFIVNPDLDSLAIEWTGFVGVVGSDVIVIPLRFCSARNARIASAVLAAAIPSVRPSVRPSVTRRYCVKTTARSTVG